MHEGRGQREMQLQAGFRGVERDTVASRVQGAIREMRAVFQLVQQLAVKSPDKHLIKEGAGAPVEPS
jgi:hypothetical protein